MSFACWELLCCAMCSMDPPYSVISLSCVPCRPAFMNGPALSPSLLSRSRRLAALAEALREAPLTKAQLGLELDELEAAALLVQQEDAARREAPGSEAGGVRESDGSSSSETEDTDSELEGVGARESAAGGPPQGCLPEHSGALLLWDGGPCGSPGPRGPAARQGRPLIEELGKQLAPVEQVSRPPGCAAGAPSRVGPDRAQD